MKQILLALKEAVLSYTPARSLVEAMMKYDFKIGEARTQLMQLCFSNFAAWPLALLLLLVYLDPFKRSWALTGVLSEDNRLLLFLTDGTTGAMLVFFLSLFLLEWIFRKEYLLVALLFYFVNRGELHIHLATVGVLGIYFARTCYLWWLSVDCESEARKIWIRASAVQMAAWVLNAGLFLFLLDWVQINFLFNAGTGLSRLGFLAAEVAGYHLLSHVLLCLWGHFYFKRKLEPSHLPVYFSTGQWALRFSMSYHLQSLLKKQIEPQLQKHIQNEKELQELKKTSRAPGAFSLENVLHKEIGYLKEAGLRLSKI